MKKIAIIPARAGSKGLPNKNVLMLEDKPLMAYTIEAAIESKEFDRVIVSTDSLEYKYIAEKFGAEVLMRDAELASDTASSFVVIEDILKKITNIDYFVLLQVTSPFRNYNHIRESIDLFEKNWEKIRKEIKNAGAILNALMADTYPEEIKNGVLVIRFPDGHKFHSRQIMELDKKSKIEAIINKICNTDIKITTIFDNDARENSDDEFIEKVINFFDGEIIEKK